MELVSRNELKQKLDRGDNFKLVMVLEDWQFRDMHIPGSLHIPAANITDDGLDPGDEIVVYCAHESCPTSVVAYNRLTACGYKNVKHYAGGILDWNRSGYAVQGSRAK